MNKGGNKNGGTVGHVFRIVISCKMADVTGKSNHSD